MKNVLIVEDDTRARARLVAKVQSIGNFTARECATVSEAMAAVDEEIAFAIIDLSLPPAPGASPQLESGVAIAQELHGRSIPYIVISSAADDPAVQAKLLDFWPIAITEKNLSDEQILSVIKVSERQAKRLNKLVGAADRASAESQAVAILSCRMTCSLEQAKKAIAGINQQTRLQVCNDIGSTHEALLALENRRLELEAEMAAVNSRIQVEQTKLQRLVPVRAR